jgi:hypothetical protein
MIMLNLNIDQQKTKEAGGKFRYIESGSGKPKIKEDGAKDILIGFERPARAFIARSHYIVDGSFYIAAFRLWPDEGEEISEFRLQYNPIKDDFSNSKDLYRDERLMWHFTSASRSSLYAIVYVS